MADLGCNSELSARINILNIECLEFPHLSSINKFISKTLCNGLYVSECGLPRSSAQQPDGLVDPAQRGHVHSLSPHGARTPNTGRVFPWTTVDNSVH